MINQCVVQGEASAWEVLENWLDGEEIQAVQFDGWPHLHMKIEGREYSSSLNTGQMASLVEFKLVMSRGYAAIAHGAYDARRLKGIEEERLEFTTKLKRGSSIAEINLSSLVDAFAQVVTTNPGMSIAAAIVVGLTFVARPIIIQHLENKARQIDAAERVKLLELSAGMTNADRDRLNTMERAIEKICSTHPQFAQVVPDAAGAFWRLAASAANAEKMNIGGLELSQAQLEALAGRRSLRQAEVDQIKDYFLVLGIVKVQGSYRVQLKSQNLHLTAMFKDPQMTPAKVKTLMTCMTESRLIDATVELKTIDKSQVIGRLLSFKPVLRAESIDGAA